MRLNDCNPPYTIERYLAILSQEESDLLGIIAIIISVFTLAFTYYSSFLNKKLEVKQNLFNEILLKNIDLIMEDFIKSINLKKRKKNREITTLINDFSNKLDVYIVHLDNIYLHTQMKSLIILKEEFCDYFFDNPDIKVGDCKLRLESFNTKMKLELFKEIENQFSIVFIVKKYCKIRTWKEIAELWKRL